MGKLFNEFAGLTFHNEAEVSQNFILPLFQGYLGYNSIEIIPERYFPAKDIYSGVKLIEGGSKSLNHRPDYVICLNGDLYKPKFIVDSKAPAENIDEHLRQLRSYSISVGKNLLLITNGKEVKVYDVNNLVFHSKDISDLQEKINLLIKLLGREHHLAKTDAEIIKDFDYQSAISITDEDRVNQEIHRKKIILSDFANYLQRLDIQYANWHLPSAHFQALNNLNLKKVDPNYLLSFQLRSAEIDQTVREKRIKLPEILTDRTVNMKIFIGDTGSGKSSLLKYLTYQASRSCLNYRDMRIPVFISLREIGYGYKLEDLILATLRRNGYNCTDVYTLPSANEFVFLLDAYDEINEAFLTETHAAIEHLSSTFPCYLTSRPSRIPVFRPSVTMDVLPVSEKEIEVIVKHHLANRRYQFQREVENRNLKTESGNILLLLFLISLFKDEEALPVSVTQVIRSMVGRVKKWQESKILGTKRFRWWELEQFLAAIAYRVIESGEGALTTTETEQLIREIMIALEQARQVPGSMTVGNVLEQLAETGLLIINNDHLYFWHRLFLNYFAGLGLKHKYYENYEKIGHLASDERWHIPIVGLAAELLDITNLITVLKDRLMLSAHCIAENNRCQESEIRRIVDELILQLKSIVPDVRNRAVGTLANIDDKYVTTFFFHVLESDYPADVRMIALWVIAKTRSPEAREIIYQNLDWDETVYWLGPTSQAYVVRALYYYGEPEHLQIIENWKRTPNFVVTSQCKNIFIELHGQKKLTKQIIATLQQFFLVEYKTEPNGPEKLDALANILALVPDDRFAEEVINLVFTRDSFFRVDYVYELMKEYRSMASIQLLKTKIFEHADSGYAIERLVEIIVDSACEIPKEMFFELIMHPNSNVASKAIGGLKRFPYKEISAELEKHLQGENPQFQSWALKVLVDTGEIIPFTKNRNFPIKIYSPAAHIMLKAVRRYHLAELMPVMDRIFNTMELNKRYLQDVHLTFDLAGTYYYMGEKNKHADIIGWFFDGETFIQRNDHIHFNLLKSLKYFDPELAVRIVKCHFRTYFPFHDKEKKIMMTVFLEAVEELSQPTLVPCVKQLVDLLAEQAIQEKQAGFQLERPMRTLINIIQPSDEDWLLAHFDRTKSNQKFEFPELRRAIECLACVGSAKSLPYLKIIAEQSIKDGNMLNLCEFAFEQICQREKIVIGNKDIFQH